MLLIAFARPLWAATLRVLRELTRLAVTALVLVVGLGGVAAAPTTSALQPTVLTSRVAEPRDDHSATTERATGDPVERAGDAPAERADRREAAHRPATAGAVALAGPARDAGGRRGPPSA